MLPRLSGYRVVERLRAEGSTVPVLMLSAKDGEYDQADGLDLGADDYLTKPFPWVVFVAPGSGPCCGAARTAARRAGRELVSR